ncbi:MAG TPA: chaperone modulator CbpM [Mycobacteriales bacterium]|nr:chaperone modulator CbpM [Mycobacteriales bacterium]
MSYALTRPTRLDLEQFARVTGLHPGFVRRLVDLELVDTLPGGSGDPTFAPDQVVAVARLRRLRAAFALNYASLRLVVDLLDRISALESALARRPPRPGGPSWTSTV